MIKPSRRNVTPVVVRHVATAESEVEPLERVPLDQREVNEDWLQHLLFSHPALLAVEEIEPDYGPLVPLGREVETAIGPIDALFVSPTGLITLVEAKLWRNPQARREVVGQILDYARQLSSWSYQDLDERVRRANGAGVWEAVSQAMGDEQLQQDEFIDAVTRNLRRARFLLLVVGDGIRESVEDLAEFLQGTPDMRFTLALVELGLYRSGDAEDLLVVPSVVGRTREIVRAVVDVTDAAEGQGLVAATVMPKVSVAERTSTGGRPRTPLDDDVFFASVRERGGDQALRWVQEFLGGVESRPVWVDATPANKIVKLRDPAGTGKDFTLIGLGKAGTIWVGSLAGQMRNVGRTFVGGPAQRLVTELAELFGKTLEKTDKHSPAPDTWNPAVGLSETAVTPHQVLTALDEYLAAMLREEAAD